MAENEQVWLVERTFTDKGLVTLVYASPDGRRMLRRQRSETALARQAVTAAIDVERHRLQPVDDPDRRERYAVEASRMADAHEPSDEI